MEATFNDLKQSFYSNIRNDEIVKNLGTERYVRDLVETMINYIKIANQIHYEFHRKRKFNIEDSLNDLESALEKFEASKDSFIKVKVSLGNLLEQQSKPMILDFSDIQNIAYSVGTYTDQRNWFKRFFFYENPLDIQILELTNHYENLKKTGDINLNYFEDDIIPHMGIAFCSFLHPDCRVGSVNKMLEKSCEYINRTGTLLQLADMRNKIHHHYSEETRINFDRGIQNNDWSWLTANWRDEKLTRKQTKEVSRYFKKQADINGLLFKALYYTCSKLKGDDNPFEETENTYNNLMNKYKSEGMIRANIVNN